MFLCLPIIFIISISDTRSDRSLSVASSFSIFTATVTGLAVRSLSMPIASAMTTCPKQPSPRGLPSVSRVLDSSHLGSAGSSSSETLARTGPSPEDSRAIRTRGVLEFIEELDSKDTCLGHQDKLVPYNVGGLGIVKGVGW